MKTGSFPVFDPPNLARAEALFQERFATNVRHTDRLFAYLLVAQWLVAIALAIWVSPHLWAGRERASGIDVQLAVFLGGGLTAIPVALALLRPGWVLTRHAIAVAQMLWSGLLIHLSGGRIETHFHVFGSLAFLAFYRDWKVLVPATIVAAADLAIRQRLWPESVYGIAHPESWRFLEHVGWLLFEDVFLAFSCLSGVIEMQKIANRQVAFEATQRVVREMELAAKIQTSILPATITVPGLEAAARMAPAEQVGGDYYDVLPVPGGCWIAIGDVAGHGMRAGLTMLQAQAVLTALVAQAPDAAPAVLWCDLNRAFFDTVRTRMRQDEHMTMSLFRYHDDGRVEVVGAHEEILIWRAASLSFEVISPEGTWVGVSRTAKAVAQTFELARGDMLILYTDGIIEAENADGDALGIEAIADAVAADHAGPVDSIRDAIFTLASERDDDATVMVFRHVGVP